VSGATLFGGALRLYDIRGSGEFSLFFLVCVVVAALYGAYSVNKRIFVVQGVPAIAALVALHL